MCADKKEKKNLWKLIMNTSA